MPTLSYYFMLRQVVYNFTQSQSLSFSTESREREGGSLSNSNTIQIEHIKCMTDAIQFPRALIHNPSSRGYHIQQLSQDSDTSSQLLDHIKKIFYV